MRQYVEVVPEVGNHDAMSQAAYQHRVELCQSTSRSGRVCSRAAGHDESVRQHPSARLHVSTDGKFVITEVFT